MSVKLSHVWKCVFFTILHVDECVCFLCLKNGCMCLFHLEKKAADWNVTWTLFMRHYCFFQACLECKDSTYKDNVCSGCYNPTIAVIFVAVSARTDSLNAPFVMMQIRITNLDHAQKQRSSLTLTMRHTRKQLTWVILWCRNLQLYPENNSCTY